MIKNFQPFRLFTYKLLLTAPLKTGNFLNYLKNYLFIRLDNET